MNVTLCELVLLNITITYTIHIEINCLLLVYKSIIILFMVIFTPIYILIILRVRNLLIVSPLP